MNCVLCLPGRFGPRCLRAASVAISVPAPDGRDVQAWAGTWDRELKHMSKGVLTPPVSPETQLPKTLPLMGPPPLGSRRPPKPVRQTWMTEKAMGGSIKVNFVPIASPVQRRRPKPGKRYKDRHLL